MIACGCAPAADLQQTTSSLIMARAGAAGGGLVIPEEQHVLLVFGDDMSRLLIAKFCQCQR